MKLAAFAALAAVATATSNVASSLRKASLVDTEDIALVETSAQWRFSSNYVPQHYGKWSFNKGQWVNGGDKRIECEACGYVLYMLVDRLGDSFDRKTLTSEMETLSTRVQWVFKSACEHIIKKHSTTIVTELMRLSEPEDICKKIELCTGDMYDNSKVAPGTLPAVMASTGMGYGAPNAAVSMETPQGYQQPDGSFGAYPAAGSRPLSMNSPYSPNSFGGYDNFGYPMAHTGVPSSTPLPPSMEKPVQAAGAAAAPAAF